jgi:hypothetical protein
VDPRLASSLYVLLGVLKQIAVEVKLGEAKLRMQ